MVKIDQKKEEKLKGICEVISNLMEKNLKIPVEKTRCIETGLPNISFQYCGNDMAICVDDMYFKLSNKEDFNVLYLNGLGKKSKLNTQILRISKILKTNYGNYK